MSREVCRFLKILNPGEALREIQNVKSAATVETLASNCPSVGSSIATGKIEARENKNTAMWKERLSNMNAEARASILQHLRYSTTSCESNHWLAGASLETAVSSASFSIQISFGAASGAKISHDFAWN